MKCVRLFFILFSFLVFYSCNPEGGDAKKFSIPIKTILKTETGILRGIEPGSTLEEIKKAESAQPLESDSGTFYYEYEIDTLGYFSIEYFFEDDVMHDCRINIYTKHEESSQQLFTEIKSFFDKKLGASVSEKGFFVWKTKNKKNEPVEISLIDESSDYVDEEASTDYAGIISLTVYKEE